MCTAANTGFIALPVLHATIGHKAILPAAVATIILVVLMLITLVLLERGSSRGETSMWPPIKRTLRNPIVLASVVGIGWAIGGVRLPAVVVSYLNLLADALAPCALFAIGLSLRLETVRSDAATIALCTLVKLVVMPALVLLAVRWVELPPVFAIAAVVCAAVPTAKVSYVLADQYPYREGVGRRGHLGDHRASPCSR